jgi:hypothetical protein
VDHVQLSGRAGPDIHRHTDASAAVVLNAGNDDRKVISILAGILREHLRVPLEATTGQDDRTGRDDAPLTVGLTHDDAVDPPLVVEGQLGRLVIVENVGGLVLRDEDQVLIDVLLATTYRVGEVLLLKVQGSVLLVLMDQLDAVVLHRLDRVRHLVRELAPVVEVRQVLLRTFNPVTQERVVAIKSQKRLRSARTSRPCAFLSNLDHGHTANLAGLLRRLQEAQRSCQARETATDDHQYRSLAKPLLSMSLAFRLPLSCTMVHIS